MTDVSFKKLNCRFGPTVRVNFYATNFNLKKINFNHKQNKKNKIFILINNVGTILFVPYSSLLIFSMIQRVVSSISNLG